MDATTGDGVSARAGRREWIGLAVLALPTLMLALDLSVVFLALPHIATDLGSSSVEQLWITDVYGFMVAGFLVTMGTLGDRIGRRRLLLIGGSAFGAASLLAAYAPTSELLIFARALLGIAGATLAPSTLALIRNMFIDERQRGTAVAVWVSCFMGGAAIGPVVGGLLLEWFWWGSVFLIGVPAMLLLLIAAPKLLPEHKDVNAGQIDLVSTLMFLATALPIIYAIKELPREGFGRLPLLALLAGLLVGAAFVQRQRTLEHPLLDLRLFGSLAFSVSLIVLLLSTASQGGVMLLATQYFQLVELQSPVQTGLWSMPPAAGMIAGSMLAPILVRRFHPADVVAAALGVSSVGYLVLTRVEPSHGIALLVTGSFLVFFGVGPVAAITQNLVVSSVPPAKAGSAASISQTAGDFGIALGVAVLGTIGTVVYRTHLDNHFNGNPGLAGETIANLRATAMQLSEQQGAALVRSGNEAFTAGLHAAALAAALTALMFAAAALYGLRSVRSQEHGTTTDGQRAA